MAITTPFITSPGALNPDTLVPVARVKSADKISGKRYVTDPKASHSILWTLDDNTTVEWRYSSQATRDHAYDLAISSTGITTDLGS